MKFVPRTRRPPAEVKTLAEARQGAPAGTIKSLALADDFLQFRGQQAGDRTARLGGEDASRKSATSSFKVTFAFMMSTDFRAALLDVHHGQQSRNRFFSCGLDLARRSLAELADRA
jgi:hypothetical protein